ncbi:MAG: cytochrome b N-terminal domain-containing protein [Pirellulaceae bacterium]|nr:cytochrome b N-terminal domain-containing protein [Pirellulaceae bacterium]
MIGQFKAWLDHRIGLSDILQHALYEPIPSGARFRYITGSVLVFAFITQAITGMFLWMAYSPSSQTAYESVYYIQHEMTGGWLLRGVHHFMAQAMVVVMALHMLQVVWDGAYRAPREVNYWLGLVLMQLVMGLGLTGYLLPWDQKGYWATNVATNLMTLVPFAGKEIQQIAVGGSEYGHHTLTRFFAMHAGILPALLLIFLVLHVAIFRRHGIMAKVTPGRPDDHFWPKQVLFDAVGCLVLLGVVLACVVHFDLGVFRGELPPEHRGAELGAPADPSEAYSAARPEWYYLFLFQLLKYFPGSTEIWGAIIIPGIVMTYLFLFPIIGKWEMGHQLNRIALVLLLVGAGGLTLIALREDAANPDFAQAKRDAAHDAERTLELINRREWLPEEGKLSDVRLIPKQGAVYLLRNDPKTRGQRLFVQHCASCHSYVNPADPKGENGPSIPLTQSPQTEQIEKGGKKVEIVKRGPDKMPLYDPIPAGAGAPNLFGFGSRAWIRGLLDPEKIAAPVVAGEPLPSKNPLAAADPENPDNYKRPLIADYFGNTRHKSGRMADWVKQHADFLKENGDAIAAALSAQAGLRSQTELESADEALIRKGVGIIQQNCINGCHRFGDDGQLGLAPDLTGYGSYEWMMGLVSDPTHERFYGRGNDRMPSFAKDLDHPAKNNVSVRELSLIVDWLRGQYYDAHDPRPVLPHTEREAEEIVRTSRTLAEPRTALVGAPPPAAEAGERAQAERLFTANCAACHSHIDAAGKGIAAKVPSAPNLFGFGSRAWLAGILDPKKIAGPEYFGNTRHKRGQMAAEFVQTDLVDLDDDGKAKLASIIAALSAEAQLPAQAADDKKAAEDKTIEKGRAAMADSFGSYSCIDCHKFHDDGALGSAPDLTGWGSQAWLTKIIANPKHEEFYRDTNDRMPSFGGAHPLLTPAEIDLLARWLRGEKLK